MKKSLVCLALCCMAMVMVFTGCSAPLANAPEKTSNIIQTGDVLVYDDYIYFANAFIDYASLQKNDNDVGKVEKEALYRVKANNGAITFDKETGKANDVELVLSKVVGSEHTFLYSIEEYIYFASPNAHKDINSADKFEHTTYFRVKTDGTGLKELYTTKNEVSKQNILNIEGKHYLIFVDGTELCKIELSPKTAKVVVLAEDFKDAVFASKFEQDGDKYAYFTKGLEEEKTKQNLSGTYLYKVDVVSGEETKVNASSYLNKTITPVCVANGVFYFTMNASDSKTYYYAYEGGNFSTVNQISAPISDITINKFIPMQIIGNNGTSQTYYIFATSTTNVHKTYVLKANNKNFSEETMLVDGEIVLHFTDGDYLYYSKSGDGIYRISIKDKQEQQISDLKEFKTEKVSFDGRYVYFYAKTTALTDEETQEEAEETLTALYYLHRADVRTAELNQNPSVKMIGVQFPEEVVEPETETK